MASTVGGGAGGGGNSRRGEGQNAQTQRPVCRWQASRQRQLLTGCRLPGWCEQVQQVRQRGCTTWLQLVTEGGHCPGRGKHAAHRSDLPWDGSDPGPSILARKVAACRRVLSNHHCPSLVVRRERVQKGARHWTVDRLRPHKSETVAPLITLRSHDMDSRPFRLGRAVAAAVLREASTSLLPPPASPAATLCSGNPATRLPSSFVLASHASCLPVLDHGPQSSQKRSKKSKRGKQKKKKKEKNAVAGDSQRVDSSTAAASAGQLHAAAAAAARLLTSRRRRPDAMCSWPHIPRPALWRPKQRRQRRRASCLPNRPRSVSFCFPNTRERTRLSDLEPVTFLLRATRETLSVHERCSLGSDSSSPALAPLLAFACLSLVSCAAGSIRRASRPIVSPTVHLTSSATGGTVRR